MRLSPSSRGVAAALATACLLLTSCGGSEGDLRVGGTSEADLPDEETSPPAATEPPEVSEAPELPESPETTEEPDLTDPGSELALGETATVAVETTSGGRGFVELTVTDARPGTTEELGRPDADGATTLVVSFEVRAVTGAADLADWQPGGTLLGMAADGRYAGAVAVAGSDVCPLLVVPPTWADGETLTGCTYTPSSADLPVAALAYAGPQDFYGTEVITWAVSP